MKNHNESIKEAELINLVVEELEGRIAPAPYLVFNMESVSISK